MADDRDEDELEPKPERKEVEKLEPRLEKSGIEMVEMWLEKTDTADPGMPYRKKTGDQGRKPPKGGDWDRHQVDMGRELEDSVIPSTDCSDRDDPAQRRDDRLKYQESRTRHQESTIARRKMRASRKDAKHTALTQRLQKRIRGLSEGSTALGQVPVNR